MKETMYPNEVPVDALLGAVGRELDALGVLAERIQEALSPALSPALLAEPGAVAGLQELDRLTQTLRALSAVAICLAVTENRRAIVDPSTVLATLPLTDLADRLGVAWKKFDSRAQTGSEADAACLVPSPPRPNMGPRPGTQAPGHPLVPEQGRWGLVADGTTLGPPDSAIQR